MKRSRRSRRKGENWIANGPQIRDTQQIMPAPLLQQASLFVAQGFRHDAFAPCPLLSVKCMFNGSALYRADRAWFSVTLCFRACYTQNARIVLAVGLQHSC